MERGFTIEEKIYQGILMLTVHDEFVLDVEKLRKKYNIDWITGDEEKYFYNYFEGGHETMQSFFKNKIQQYDNNDIEEIEYKVLDSYKKYKRDVQAMMTRYNLTSEYETAVDVYVQQGFILGDSSIIDHSLNCPIIDKNNDYIVVKVFPNTTKKEYDESWMISQILLKCLSKDKRVLKKSMNNVKRDVEIMKLKKNGKTSKEIYEIVKGSDKFENKLSGYDEVPIITKRLNDHIKKLIAH